MIKTDNHFPIKTRNLYLLIIGILTVFNIVAFTIFIKTGSYDLNGNYKVLDQAARLKTSLMSILIAFPLLSLLLALIVSLFPYKQLAFGKKYFRSFLLSLGGLNILFAIGHLFIIFMTIVGLYPSKEFKNKTVNNEKKQKVIADFKGEMKTITDSSLYYFDMAITEIQEGKKIKAIKDKVAPKLLYYKNLINKKSREFRDIAISAGLSNEEYDKVFSDLKILYEPLGIKNQFLQKNGIVIE